MYYIVLLFSLFIAILLEATVLNLPLAFIFLLCYSILNRTSKVFKSAFVAGIVLDIFLIRQLGLTATFFMIFFSFILLYQSKYEIRSYLFVAVSSLTGSYLYSLILSDGSFFQAIISMIIALFLFGIGKKLKDEEV